VRPTCATEPWCLSNRVQYRPSPRSSVWILDQDRLPTRTFSASRPTEPGRVGLHVLRPAPPSGPKSKRRGALLPFLECGPASRSVFAEFTLSEAEGLSMTLERPWAGRSRAYLHALRDIITRRSTGAVRPYKG
jgi:hypothetical protein